MKSVLIEPLETRQMLCDLHAVAALSAPTGPSLQIVAPESAVISHAASTNVSWSKKAAMPQKREEGQSAVINGKLYVFGGFYDSKFNASKRVDVYDPKANKWKRLKDMPEAITHAPTITIGSTAWIFGGYVGRDPGPATKHVWKYDANKDSWSRGPDLPQARGAGAAAMVNSTVYFFGGRNDKRTYDVAQTLALNLSTGKWSTKANLPNPRNHLAGAAVNGKVYAIGGQHGEAKKSKMQTSVHVYDPKSNTWKSVKSLPTAISHTVASTFEYKGRIFMAGGEKSHNNSTARLYMYNPGNNTWKFLGDMPGARRSPQAGIIDGKFYVAGGSLKGSQKPDLFVSSSLDQVI